MYGSHANRETNMKNLTVFSHLKVFLFSFFFALLVHNLREIFKVHLESLWS